MLSNVKLRMFTKAVLLKMKSGQNLDDVLNEYTKLTDEEKQQLREAVEKENDIKNE